MTAALVAAAPLAYSPAASANPEPPCDIDTSRTIPLDCEGTKDPGGGGGGGYDIVRSGNPTLFECLGITKCLAWRGTGTWGDPLAWSTPYLEVFAKPVTYTQWGQADAEVVRNDFAFSASNVQGAFACDETTSVGAETGDPTASADMVFLPDDTTASIVIQGQSFNPCSQDIERYVLDVKLIAPSPVATESGYTVSREPGRECKITYSNTRRGVRVSSALFQWVSDDIWVDQTETVFSPAKNGATVIAKELQFADAGCR